MISVETEGYDAYLMYLAVQRHFKTASYDFHKYRGKVNASASSFNNRPDRWKFVALEREYKNGLLEFYVSCFMHNKKAYIGKMQTQEYITAHKNRMKIFSNFTFYIEEEYTKLFDYLDECDLEFVDLFTGETPPLIQAYLGNIISLETLIVISKILPKLYSKMDSNITDPFVWPDVKKNIEKYSGFVEFNLQEALKLLRKHVELRGTN